MIRTTLCVLATGLAVAAQAQPRPEPPPPPDPRGAALADLMLPEEFARAYEAAGSPRLLFAVHTTYLAGSARRTLDEQSATDAFAARLQQRFVADPRITVVDVPTAPFRERAEFDALARNDLHEAARMLGRDARADVVVLVMLTEQVRADGVKYAANYVMADVNRGRRIGVHSFEVRPSDWDYEHGRADRITLERWSDYARALTRRIVEDFWRAYPEAGPVQGGRSYTLRFAGIAPEEVTRARDAVRGLPGVRSTARVQFDDHAGLTVASMDAVFTGEPIDLAHRASEAVSRALGTHVTFRSTREGLIVFEATPRAGGPAPRGDWLRLRGTPASPNAVEPAQRERVEREYAASNSPRVAVVVTRRAVPHDAFLLEGPDEVDPFSGAVNVIVAPRINVGSTESPAPGEPAYMRDLRERRRLAREDEQLLAPWELEDQLLGWLRALRLSTVVVDSAMLEGAAESGTGRAEESRLAGAVGRAAIADIVISAVGSVARERAGAPRELRYTFRAFRTSDGAVLGATTVARDLGARNLDAAALRSEVAAEAAGKIVGQLVEAWVAPRTIRAVVRGVSGLPELNDIAEWIKGLGPEITAVRVRGLAVAESEDSGYLDVEFKGDLEAVTRAFARSGGDPVRVERLDATGLVLRVQR